MKLLFVVSAIVIVYTTRVKAACWSESLGYPCCTETNQIFDIDEDGEWGVQNDGWCGIPKYNNGSCWSKAFGYNCCITTNDVVYQDSEGEWGVENNDWCGIAKQNKPSSSQSQPQPQPQPVKATTTNSPS